MATPYYLQFKDEAQAIEVLYTVTPSITVDDVVTADAVVTPNYANIDTIGVIYMPAPDPVPEDYVPVPYDGWYVNVLVLDSEDPAPLQGYTVAPKVPLRVWAE